MKRTGLFLALALGSLASIPDGGVAFATDVDTASVVTEPILSRPTESSVRITVVPNDSLQLYYEYGREPLTYLHQSETRTSATGIPVGLVLRPLAADTRYYYRLRYKKHGTNQFLAGEEHTFTTQRSRGRSFRFTIEADPHPYDKKGSHTLWPITMRNQLADSADFMIDLGDTFGDDHDPLTITSDELRQLHFDCLQFFGLVCHSAPLFLCLGNHEGESGYYLLQTPPENIAVYGTLWRNYYYSNPVPDEFYSGNTTAEGYGIDLPENYYAWEWGDALFIVLDAYRGYTASAKPRGWEWTLGKVQYDWLKQTLESSQAKYKFVFAHHTLGETRGGAGTANLYEWGGYEADGRTWGFSANRPGWSMPIHQLMVQNGVNIYFQGHDHLFATEELDGMVYQEVPMPSDSTYIIGVRDNGDSYTGVKIDGSGHLRVSVAPESVRVDYVQAYLPANEDATHRNGQIAYSYTVKPTLTSAGREVRLPARTTLDQNYPNPFNPATTIRFELATKSYVIIRVHDILGREAARLVDQWMDAGAHLVRWDASEVPSGVYFYQLRSNGSVETRKAIIVK